jgi:hypothetical protein
MKNKKRSETARLRNRVKELKLEMECIRADRDETEKDRSKFRDFFIQELRRQIDCNGRGQYYPAKQMIERYSEFLGKVESWYWR